MKLSAVSLFAGVGGFDIGLQRAGIHVNAAVEIDPAARGVLKHRFPTTTLFDDVCEVTGDDLSAAGFMGDSGIIVGGFPCQDLSVAGRRAGLAGARSGLFWEIMRLADETKARWLVLENVPGLLSSNDGRDMGTVLGALGDLGYGFAYRVLDAQHFGVPQRRRRVFIVANLGNDGSAPFEVLAIGEGSARDSAKGKPSRQDSAVSITGSTGAGCFTRSSHGTYADGVGTLQASGGDFGGGSENIVLQPTGILGSDLVGALCARDFKGVGNQFVNENKVVVQPVDDRQVMNTLPAELYHHGTVVNQDVNSGHLLIVKSAVFPIQGTIIGRADTAGPGGPGFADDGSPMFTLDKSSTIAARDYKDATNLIVQDQAAVAFVKAARARDAEDAETWREDAVAPTLNIFDNGGDSRATVLNVEPPAVVRRLTPTECERLQGFPDGWTAERYDFKKDQVVPQADSARYKQMGNAVAVPVVTWILQRLAQVDEKRNG